MKGFFNVKAHKPAPTIKAGSFKPTKKYLEEAEKIRLIYEVNEAIEYLEELLEDEDEFLAFDYEGTGLKPYSKGQKLVCISFSRDEHEGAAMPIFHESKRFMMLLKKVLTNEKIKKIAHNVKFEHTWTEYVFGYAVKLWGLCTLLGEHIIDNSIKAKDLKTLVEKNFEVGDYNSEINPFLKSDSSRELNNVEKAPLNKLLLYCGLDSMFTYRLAMLQFKRFDRTPFLYEGLELFMEGSITLSEMQQTGISIDLDYLKEQREILNKKIKRFEKRIQESEEVKLWRKKTNNDFNPGSDPQMRKLLFDYLGLKPYKETDGGEASVDAESIEKLADQVPLLKTILEQRKISKIRDYLDGIERETENGICHPNYNLHKVVSFRSSSDHINFQNIPKRDKYAKKLIRNCFVPRPGRMLVEVDYSGAEVAAGACYHKDPVMLKYLEDKVNNDMHRDMAQEIYLLSKDQVTKDIRHASKNQFVFPEFYGSYYAQCAPDLWHSASSLTLDNGAGLINWLDKKGLSKYSEFEDHLKKVEKKFWYDRFSVYTEWKDRMLKEYERDGNFETLTGFQYNGFMKKNEVLNYRIQGTAFHWLLWSINRIRVIAKEEGWKSLLLGQIHDAIVADVVPEELDHVLYTFKRVMTEDIKEHWPWIIVPLEIEAEVSAIREEGGTWAEMNEMEIMNL